VIDTHTHASCIHMHTHTQTHVQARTHAHAHAHAHAHTHTHTHMYLTFMCIHTFCIEEEYVPKSGEESDGSESCSSGVEEVEEEEGTAPTTEEEGESIVTPAKKVYTHFTLTYGNHTHVQSRACIRTGE